MGNRVRPHPWSLSRMCRRAASLSPPDLLPGRRAPSVRLAICVALSTLASFAAFVVFRALGVAPWMALGTTSVFFAGLTWHGHRHLPLGWEELADEPRRLWMLGVLGLLLAALLIGRLSVFMLSPGARDASVEPGSEFLVRHSCLTAYHEAARLIDEVPNVYEPSLYRTGITPRQLDGFNVDFFEYPPQFLLLPRLLSAVTEDYLTQRSLWFFGVLACFSVGVFGLSAWVGGDRLTTAALLAPSVLLAVPSRVSLQMGNFQLAALALAVLGMIAFDRKRMALGGALLALTTVTKLFPGVLVLYLIASRRYREVSWTLGFALLFTGLAAQVFGLAPLESFVSFQLPRLASGEAFPMLKNVPFAVAINHSIFGVPLKLGLAGAPGMSFAVAAGVTWFYTAALAAVAVLAARLRLDRAEQARLWLVLLGMAALRSPFLPQHYAVVPALWLCTLLPVGAHDRQPRARAWPLVLFAGAWLLLNYDLTKEDFDAHPAALSLLYAALPQVIHWTLLFGTLARLWWCARQPRPAPALLSPSPSGVACDN